MAKSPARNSGEPTAPRPHDLNGYELDEWGLPLVGPARIGALEKLGRRDPCDFPEDWPKKQQPDQQVPAALPDAEVVAAPELKEKSNG